MLACVVIVGVVVAWVPGHQPGAAAGQPTAGEQGTDTSLPATDSAVTLSAQGLTISVNQTRNLVNQAISISWKGGTQTTGQFSGNYLQIFQCWGDPQSTDPPNPADPGPLPTQCEFGGESANASVYPTSGTGFEYSRVLTQPGWGTDGQIPGYTDTSTGFVIDPFLAVDGTTVNQEADYNYATDLKSFWLNPYFSYTTTNEIDFARTYADGSGQQLFQVDTGLEAPGLGCGQDIEPVPGGTKVPQCWLVIVPRSTATQENPSGVPADRGVVTSPLTPEAWSHRIAIPLSFNPVGSSCSINANATGIIGSELAGSAVASWQPALCALPGSSPYSYLKSTDDQARTNITSPTYGSVGMSVFSNPIDPSQVSSSDPVVYAPLTLSGVVVGFNIQRVPSVTAAGQQEVPLSGERVQHLYLTPRLVAKLLTESYQAQFVDITASKPAGYSWVLRNPTSLVTDPDFLQYNPEFTLLSSTQQLIDAGTLVVEETSSDATETLWKWVLADRAARSWLSGAPDPWGMTVNPLYSTNPDVNPTGVAFGTPTPESFPKSDPYCFQDTTQTVAGPPRQPARPECFLDWSPYATSQTSAAQGVAAANDGAKTTLDPNATSPNTAWTANGPQPSGTDLVLCVTDSASAARYGLQTASLSRAGDDASSPTFVAPDDAGLLAGEASMTAGSNPDVLQANPSTSAAGAYPLTMLTYGATTPESLSASDRGRYAAFIQYAVGAGQTSGDQPGDLPAGYVPLPAGLQAQALAAAASILHPSSQPSSPGTGPTSGTGGGGVPAGAAAADSGSAGGGTGATTTSAPTSTPNTTSPARTMGPAALTTIKGRGIPIGLLRWALPIVVLIGLAALIGAVAVDRAKRRLDAGAELGTSPGSGVDPPEGRHQAAAGSGFGSSTT